MVTGLLVRNKKGDKMKKIVILVCLLFFITGCTVTYNVSINEDLTVTEEALITPSDDLYDIYYKTSRSNVLKEFLEEYREILQQNNYTSEVIKDSNPYIKLHKTYQKMEDYIQNGILFNDYFDEIKYSKDDDIVKIETIGFNPINDEVPERFSIDKVVIGIKSSYEVVSSNAKKVDKKSNTYYFELYKDTEDFKIILEYDTSKKFNPNKNLYLMILIFILMVIVSWIFVGINKRKKG